MHYFKTFFVITCLIVYLQFSSYTVGLNLTLVTTSYRKDISKICNKYNLGDLAQRCPRDEYDF